MGITLIRLLGEAALIVSIILAVVFKFASLEPWAVYLVMIGGLAARTGVSYFAGRIGEDSGPDLSRAYRLAFAVFVVSASILYAIAAA
jgi:hypothetical protein